MKTRAFLSALSIGLFAMTAVAQASDGYSHDGTTGATNTDWMASISDYVPISTLSLPGTHDSGAYKFGGDAVLTQSMDLQAQLNAGIRAWDIRLGQETGNTALTIYHGSARQGQSFERDVLTTASNFLAAHPSETILMHVKCETEECSGFDNLVRASLNKYPRAYTKTGQNLQLGDVRGKIVLLRNFDLSADPNHPGQTMPAFGIPWGNLTIQNEYKADSNWDLAKKWRYIKAQLDNAQNGPSSTTYVNFLSAATGGFPYFFASGKSSPGTGAPGLLTGYTRGIINTCSSYSDCLAEYPSVNCFLGTCSVAFKGANDLTTDEITKRPSGRRYGVLYADFPGKGLIQAIINSNPLTVGVLKGVGSGRCIDAHDGRLTDGTPAVLWDCNGGATQRWQFDGAHFIVFGTKCLTVSDGYTDSGTPVQISSCNGSFAQMWMPWGSMLRNYQYGQCLDTASGSNENLTPLIIRPCTGTSSQSWQRFAMYS